MQGGVGGCHFTYREIRLKGLIISLWVKVVNLDASLRIKCKDRSDGDSSLIVLLLSIFHRFRQVKVKRVFHGMSRKRC